MENGVGVILKGLREKFDYTQNSVAEYLGINRELVSDYETGRVDAPIEVLEKLSNLFGVELDLFFTDNLEEAIAGVAFAYRKDELNVHDMMQIANFGKIVKNYLKIKRLNESSK